MGYSLGAEDGLLIAGDSLVAPCGLQMAQLVKNPPAMRETRARSLGWEDPLEKGKASHSTTLAWRIQSMGVAKNRTRLTGFHFHLASKYSFEVVFIIY